MAEQMTTEREDRIASMYGRAFVATQQAVENLREGYPNTDRQVLKDAVEGLTRYLNELDGTPLHVRDRMETIAQARALVEEFSDEHLANYLHAAGVEHTPGFLRFAFRKVRAETPEATQINVYEIAQKLLAGSGFLPGGSQR